MAQFIDRMHMRQKHEGWRVCFKSLLLDCFLLALLAWASLGIYDFMHWRGCLCLSFHIFFRYCAYYIPTLRESDKRNPSLGD